MLERGYRRRLWMNRLMLTLSGGAAALAIAVLIIILIYTISHGVAYLNLDFLTQAAKPVGETGGGMKNEIIGTFLLVALGSVIALPIGLMTGIFLSEFGGPRTAGIVRFMADILAGVPSIVVGVFVYALVVKPMHTYSAFAGGIALAIIMIPVIARTSEEAMRLVPNTMRESALALGITRWRSVMSVVIPGAITGIMTGIMLAVARIAGETAPLIFTALGTQFGFNGLFKPIGSMPVQIYHNAISPYLDLQQQAWAGAFLLVMLVLVISIIVRWLSSRRRG